ncbi:hypothetical protein [Streptomyces sp. NPDC050704]|uniref:hypothetical protein n=1 Tax=Streptomyces sp. NPDC050704 TaxID=3157219 RepID=UPI00344918CC
MGSLRLTLCAGAVVAAALTPAPAAYAADGGVSVTPASPAPGSDIELRVQGCTGMSGTAASEAFVADARLTARPDGLTGETRVRSTLDPGTYDVKVTCDGIEDKIKGTLTVVQKNGQKQNPKPTTTQSSPTSPTAPASPVAPVQAGGGGTARLAAVEARSEGPGTRHAVIGLVLAGVTAVAVAVRSARRGRGGTD